MTPRTALPEPSTVLRLLKDFQRDTVEHVFRRLYLDEPHTRRFLVADEVGLGKTMVARGVIALTLKHLVAKDIQRLDVVYVCSNGAIAQQNIRRLNVTGLDNVALPTRLSLLPLHVKKLESSRVNFISLTPNTSFRNASRGGTREERVLLWAILRPHLPAELHQGLANALQCTVVRENWLGYLRTFDGEIDDALADRFRKGLDSDLELRGALVQVCEDFHDFREYEEIPGEESQRRYDLVGELRALMARVCVGALEPDLIILDEFQRFADLLRGDDDAALLTREFLNYRDPTGHHARTLLLSGTPYRMVSLDHEDEDHYQDFLETCRFLFDGKDHEVDRLESELKAFRRCLLIDGDADAVADRARQLRTRIEERLRRVMVRTERVPATHDREAMLAAPDVPAHLAREDLDQVRIADQAARILDSQDIVEYWKSAPYLLNLMRGYQLKRRINDAAESGDPALGEVVRMASEELLEESAFEAYRPVAAANPRLRALLADTVERGMWRLLWMPPSQPYMEPAGAYEGMDRSVTKALVFSKWSVVPDAISALCSYEVERRMVGERLDHRYSHLNQSVSSSLRFDVRDGQYTGQYSLLLFYPSPTLAVLGDPLSVAEDGESLPLGPDVVRGRVRNRILRALGGNGVEQANVGHAAEGREDQTWYWRAVAHLDRTTRTASWAGRKSGWASVLKTEGPHGSDGFVQHIRHFQEALEGQVQLPETHPPDDLLDVLTLLALGSPATCALRALHRIAPGLPLDDRDLLTAAARVGQAFRSLFDLAETILLLRQKHQRRYWERILLYAVDGNLQAVLDEYAHVLVEALGLVDADPGTRVLEVAREMEEALSLRTSRVGLDEIETNGDDHGIRLKRFNLRTRFALRFGDIRDEEESNLQRADTVRSAFNSPFRPFILASTSVGQEGLDFHLYCHAVYHWNLPSNPVDLEQREGRVHRYKGHAVRKNIAQVHGAGIPGLHQGRGDPWEAMFQCAVRDRPPGVNDLVPFWIYEEGDARIERRIPLIPLTREVARARRLIQSLATYRMVIGQPRQEDLLTLLAENGNGAGAMDPSGAVISLRPPRRRGFEVEEERAAGD